MEFTLGRPDWHEKWLSWSIWFLIFILAFFVLSLPLFIFIYIYSEACMQYISMWRWNSQRKRKRTRRESSCSRVLIFAERERDNHYHKEEIWRFFFSSSIDDLIIKWMINVWVFVLGVFCFLRLIWCDHKLYKIIKIWWKFGFFF